MDFKGFVWHVITLAEVFELIEIVKHEVPGRSNIGGRRQWLKKSGKRSKGSQGG